MLSKICFQKDYSILKSKLIKSNEENLVNQVKASTTTTLLSKGSVMKFVPNNSSSKIDPSFELSNQTSQIAKTNDQMEHLNFADLDEEKLKYLELDNLKKMSKSDLISVRESISLEMLWIQQAIQSRIQVKYQILAHFYSNEP